MLTPILKTDTSLAPVFLRVSLGVVIFAHGAQKVLGLFGGPGFSKTIEIFRTQMGFPTWMIVLLMVIEFFGSLGLIFGFLTRLCALCIGTSIAVCAYMNHLQNGFFMNWFGTQKGEGFEYHILVLGIALALIVKGGGFLSFDRIFVKSKRTK
jgi:putative oxidoreductase